MGRPEITATNAKGMASSARRAGTPGSGRAPVGSSTMDASVPSKSRNSALRSGSAASGRSGAGRRARAVARRSHRQEVAVVVVVVEARSWPMTTTTSVPVTPLTGVAVVSASTCDGATPMVVAIDAAACC